MWDWDPSQGESPPGTSTPTLVSSKESATQSQCQTPQPVVIPNVQGLKQQFLKQQSLLTQMKETLRENDADRATKEKKLEMYVKKLSLIKSRSKTASKSEESDMHSQLKENLVQSQVKASSNLPADRNLAYKGKMSELQKRLEENKIKFEERTEHGITETKKIETMVEQLRNQVQQSDASIHQLQNNIKIPSTKPKVNTKSNQAKARKTFKEHALNISQSTQTHNLEQRDLNPRIQDLEATISELKDTIKNQASIIEANKRAASLLSKDLSEREKNSVSEVENVKREMQDNFELKEEQYKIELSQRDNRITYLEEQLSTLESRNIQLTSQIDKIEKNQQELISEKQLLVTNLTELSKNCFVTVDSHSLETVQLEEKVAQLTKELDDSNKLMIRLKLEHKNKLKAANKALDKLKQNSDHKGGNVESGREIEELTNEVSKLKEKIAVLEDEKVSILADNGKLQESTCLKDNEILKLKCQLHELEEEKKTLLQTLDDLNMLVENLSNKHPIQLDSFPLPGDSVAVQFDIANQSVQHQIGSLVQEKQQLMEKLKNLARTSPGSAQNTEEQETIQTRNESSEDSIGNLSSEDKTVKSSDRKGSNDLRKKIKKLELELEKNRIRVDELSSIITTKEEEIQNLEEKIAAFENENEFSSGNIDVLDKQHTCLSLENSLMQKIQQCEHLRRENLELSEEKVLRTRAEEEVEVAERLLQEANALNARITALEEGVAELKQSDQRSLEDFERANIVIASRDTEIFNLESALADKSEKLETTKHEVHLLHQDIENLAMLLGNGKALSDLSISTACAPLRSLIDALCQIERNALHSEDQSAAYKMHINELSATLKAKTNELDNCKRELHRLQVALDSTLTESKLNSQERDAKIEQLSSMLQDSQSRLKDLEALCRQRDEALLRAEETEKVLQSTWAERNDLIQSRDFICQKLNEAERNLTILAKEKENAIIDMQVLSQQLGEAKSKIESNSGVEFKQQELDAMTTKAKKLAANLKKKAQIEKELLQQVNLLTSENEALLSKLNDGGETYKKFEEEQVKLISKQGDLLNEKQNITKENIRLNENIQILLQQVETLNCQVQELQHELNTLKCENEKLVSEVRNVENEKQALENIFDENKKKCVELNENCTVLFSQNAALQHELDEVQDKWTLEVKERGSLIVYQKELLSELNGIKHLCDQQEQEILALKAEKTEMLQQNENLSMNCQNQVLRLQNLEVENNSLLTEIKKLQVSINALAMLETENNDLSEKLSQLTSEKAGLEKELKFNKELVMANDSRVNDLSNSIAHLQSMLTSLQEDKVQMEQQWAAFGEKSSSEVDKYINTISHLEKQVNNFNIAFDAEVQKNNVLKTQLEESRRAGEQLETEVLRLSNKPTSYERTERKKKKSVTFRTDDTDYIKELRGEVATLQKALENSDATVGELKAALDKEKPETPVDKEEVVKAFRVGLFEEPATDNLLSDSSHPDPFSDESLTWDDGWGADGHLEAEHQAISQQISTESTKIAELEAKIKSLHTEKEALLEDHRVLQVKYTKVIKKLKEQKIIIDRLQTDVKIKNSADTSYLDAAIMEELRSEINKAESREVEIRKELDSLKLEKEQLLKTIDVLNAGNERFLEMKERQDSDAAMWVTKQADLRARIVELEAQLEAPALDDAQISIENRELKNLIEGLEWKVSELTEMVEEKDEELERLNNRYQGSGDLEKKYEPGNKSESNLLTLTTEKLADAEQQLSLLAAENETLQDILNQQKIQSHNINAPGTVAPSSALAQLFPPDDSESFLGIHDASLHETADSNNYQKELEHLKQLIVTKDEEIEKMILMLEKERLAFENEKELLLNKLSAKDEEIKRLMDMASVLEKAYNESKIEIQRLIEEERLRSDSPAQDELRSVRKTIEAEYQSLLKNRDDELLTLRQSLYATERDWDETQMNNNEVVKQLKEQLRELDASTTKVIEEREIENRELRAQYAELQTICACREAEIARVQNQLASLNEAIESKDREYSNSQPQLEATKNELLLVNQSLDAIKKEYSQMQELLEDREREILAVTQATIENSNLSQSLDEKIREIDDLVQEAIVKDNQILQLKDAIATRENEIREMRNTLQSMHDEISQFRNFDNQLKEIRLQDPSQAGNKTRERGDSDWGGNEAQDLSNLLQSDLDNALYLLHQRDVRCDELTFELTQLLEERDTLQLRLSAEIRKNAELITSCSTSDAHLPRSLPRDEAEGELAHKLSELQTIEYGRDKNIQDDSVQRYREQMDLLSREARLKANTVFDV